MKSVKLSDHLDDAGLYFRECYGLFEDEKGGKQSYMQFRGYDGRNISINKYDTGGRINNAILPKNAHKRITFPTVSNGFVNILSGNGINKSVYVDRRPVRQFAWGLNRNSYILKEIDNGVSRKIGEVMPPMSSLNTLEHLFNPEYYTVRRAINLLMKGSATSVALSKDIALAFKWGANNIQIFSHQSIVGRVEGTTAILYKETVFAKEVLGEYFRIVKEEGEDEAA